MNGVPDEDGLHEAQLVDAVEGDHRIGDEIHLHHQAARYAQRKQAVGDPLTEGRLAGVLLVSMQLDEIAESELYVVGGEGAL